MGRFFRSRFFLLLALSVCTPLFAGPGLPEARNQAAAVFQKKCSACHDSPDDSNGIFGPGWLPCAKVKKGECRDTKAERDALMDRVMKSVRYEAGVKKMPPPKNPAKDSDYNDIRGALDAGQIAQLQTWASAEATPPTPVGGGGGGGPVAPVTPVAPPVSADPLCQIASEAPAADANRLPVTDAEAALIMSNSCAGCHGDVGTFSSREKKVSVGIALAGALAIAAIKGTAWAKRRLNPGAEKTVTPIPSLSSLTPSLWESCTYQARRLGRSPLRLTLLGTATFAAFYLGTGQMIKYGHIRGKSFQDGDQLDPTALANGNLSLAKFHTSIVSGSMPIDLPTLYRIGLFPWASYPSDHDRQRLATWVEQLQDTRLKEGCTVYLAPDSKLLTYEGAVKACNDRGMRLPTSAQMQKLIPQGAAASVAGPDACLWTSGFSNDAHAPREGYRPGQGLTPLSTKAKCQALCYR